MSKARINEETILAQVEERVDKVEKLKLSYKEHYDAIKKIESEVALQAGAIDALKTLLQTQESKGAKGESK